MEFDMKLGSIRLPLREYKVADTRVEISAAAS
jgi:hypothetical protein